MHELVEALETLAEAIDVIGVIIVLYGFVLGLVGLIKVEFRSWIGADLIAEGHQKIRLKLGTYILLGIEFMIASDIIATVLSKSIDSLIFVASLVLIRTAISFFLGKELGELATEPQAAQKT